MKQFNEITSSLFAIAATAPTCTVRWLLPRRKYSEVLLTTSSPTEKQFTLLHVERLNELEYIITQQLLTVATFPPTRGRV